MNETSSTDDHNDTKPSQCSTQCEKNIRSANYRSFFIIGFLFTLSLSFLYAIYLHFPNLDE